MNAETQVFSLLQAVRETHPNLTKVLLKFLENPSASEEFLEKLFPKKGESRKASCFTPATVDALILERLEQGPAQLQELAEYVAEKKGTEPRPKSILTRLSGIREKFRETQDARTILKTSNGYELTAEEEALERSREIYEKKSKTARNVFEEREILYNTGKQIRDYWRNLLPNFHPVANSVQRWNDREPAQFPFATWADPNGRFIFKIDPTTQEHIQRKLFPDRRVLSALSVDKIVPLGDLVDDALRIIVQ